MEASGHGAASKAGYIAAADPAHAGRSKNAIAERGASIHTFFARAGSAIPRRFAAAATGRLPMSPQRLVERGGRQAVGGARARAAAALAQVSSASALQFAARTASDLEFRRVLLDHQLPIRPIFCLFYPHFFSLQLVATTTTDDCGHFHTLFFRGCNNPDTPDLYFKSSSASSTCSTSRSTPRLRCPATLGGTMPAAPRSLSSPIIRWRGPARPARRSWPPTTGCCSSRSDRSR